MVSNRLLTLEKMIRFLFVEGTKKISIMALEARKLGKFAVLTGFYILRHQYQPKSNRPWVVSKAFGMCQIAQAAVLPCCLIWGRRVQLKLGRVAAISTFVGFARMAVYSLHMELTTRSRLGIHCIPSYKKDDDAVLHGFDLWRLQWLEPPRSREALTFDGPKTVQKESHYMLSRP